MDPKGVFSKLNYARCVALSTVIFSKPGNVTKILHSGPDAYYICLLHLQDLTVIGALSDAQLQAKSNDDWRFLLKHAKFDIDALEDLPEEAADGAVDVLVPVLGAKPDEVLIMKEPTLTSKPLYIKGYDCRIHFDNYTHLSGRPRAFTYCKDIVFLVWKTAARWLRCLPRPSPIHTLFISSIRRCTTVLLHVCRMIRFMVHVQACPFVIVHA